MFEFTYVFVKLAYAFIEFAYAFILAMYRTPVSLIFLAAGFSYVLINFAYAIIIFAFAFFAVCAPIKMTLYSQNEVQQAVNGLKQVAEFTTPWLIEDYLADVAADDLEGLAFQSSKNLLTEIDPGAPKIKLYTELKGEVIPGAKLTGQVMARLISFLKQHGHYSTVQTQDVGNCLYAAVLRGTGLKREAATMMLRRAIVKHVCQFPAFYCKYLRKSVAQTFGHQRRDPEEVNRLEREGEISPDDAADQRLPGPFSLVTFLEHILTDRTWGDHHILTIISCMWQVTVTILHAEDLFETRIRHNRSLPDVDLVVIFTGGNHFMGCRKYISFYLRDH